MSGDLALPHERSLGRSLFGASAIRLLTLPVGAACTFVNAALAIQYAGSLFGYVSLVSTLFLLIPFTDLGLGAAVTNAVSSDPARSRRTVVTVVRLLSIVGVLVVVIAGVLGLTGGWSQLLAIPEEVDFADTSVAVAVVLLGIGVPLGVGQRVLVGTGRVKELTLWNALAPVLSVFWTVVLILAGAPPMLLSTATAGSLAVVGAVVSLRAWRVLPPAVRVEAGHAAPPPRVWGTALPYLALTIGVAATLQSGRLVLSHRSSAEELAVYGLTAQLFTPALSVATMGAVGLWPMYRRTGAEPRAIWGRALLVLAGLGLVLGSGFALLAVPVARLISQGNIAPSWSLAITFGVLLLLLSLHQASGLLLTEGRHLWFQAGWTLVTALVAVSLSLVLAGPAGALGVAVATVVGVALCQFVPNAIYARSFLDRRTA